MSPVVQNVGFMHMSSIRITFKFSSHIFIMPFAFMLYCQYCSNEHAVTTTRDTRTSTVRFRRNYVIEINKIKTYRRPNGVSTSVSRPDHKKPIRMKVLNFEIEISDADCHQRMSEQRRNHTGCNNTG